MGRWRGGETTDSFFGNESKNVGGDTPAARAKSSVIVA
jgi:hypothetical protein